MAQDLGPRRAGLGPRLAGFGPRRAGVLLQVAYDGTGFHGWASQAGTRTVEDTLRGAVLALDPRVGKLRGCSRTDAGVHAEAQMVAFDAERDIPSRGWVLGVNQHLPDDVAVRAARSVEAQWSPRFAARGKRYRYRVLVDVLRDPRWHMRAWRLPVIDLALMEQEGRAAVGTHDFAAFRSAGDERAVTVRTLTRVAIEPDGADPRVVGVVVEGSAFLYNMVRILVGTMADVARGRLPPGGVARALEARDRRVAGTTAPAHGLTLEHVDLELPEGAGEPWPR